MNQKAPWEIPDDWRDEIKNTMQNLLNPFSIWLKAEYGFFSCHRHLTQFPPTFPFPTRRFRELKITKEEVEKFSHRDTFSGACTISIVYEKRSQGRNTVKPSNPDVEPPLYNAQLLEPLYSNTLPISQANFKDFMHLKRLCSPVPNCLWTSNTYSTSSWEWLRSGWCWR